MKKILLTLILLFYVSFVAAGFDISPDSETFTKDQGEKLSSSFLINNTGTTNISFVFPTEINLTSSEDQRTVSVTFSPSTVTIPFNETAPISFESSNLPSTMYAGSYTGSFDITDNESNTETYDITLTLNPKESFTLDRTAIDFGELFYNETGSDSFTITNNGNVNLSNLGISSNANSKYDLDFDPDSIDSLAPGQSIHIDVTVSVPFGEDTEENMIIGDLTIGSETFSDFFILDVMSYLNLKKVRVKVDSETQTINNDGEEIDEKAEPLSRIELDIEVENLWDEEANQEIEINDVEVEIIVFGIDEDDEDLEFTSESFDLDFEGNDKRYTFEFNFDVPIDVLDDTYDIEIRIIGTDDEDNDYDIAWTIQLKVGRESHELIINDFRLNPSQLSCTLKTVADFEIINLGKDDEDYVRYTLKNSDLGINYEKSRFEIEYDTDNDDNKYRENIPITLQNPSPGTYPIELRIYRNFDILEQVSGLNLVITECGQSQPEPTPEPEPEPTPEPEPEPEPEEEQPEEKEETIIPMQKPKVEISDSPSITGMPVIRSIKDFRQSDTYTVLLFTGLLVVIALIVILLILSRKK